jgi:prepilin-type N-terminal cleavage/methylation domain-containing protein
MIDRLMMDLGNDPRVVALLSTAARGDGDQQPAAHVRKSRMERGFTLIEIMVAVAIVAVLSYLVIPTFAKEARKSKGGSEVAYMFGELAVREDQYKLEKGSYLAATACPTTLPAPSGVLVSTLQVSGGCDAPSTSAWDQMRVRLGESKLYCQYTISVGTGTGTSAPTGFTWSSPATAWYYLQATCDGDGNTATNATYFLASTDTTVQKLNEGF